jgi:hypothetical protein
MRQKRTPTTNHVFELPGGNEDNSLFVEIHVDEAGNPVITSVWDLDDDERALIAQGGTIELHVWGTGTPPVAVSIGPSLEQRREEARQ